MCVLDCGLPIPLFLSSKKLELERKLVDLSFSFSNSFQTNRKRCTSARPLCPCNSINDLQYGELLAIKHCQRINTF